VCVAHLAALPARAVAFEEGRTAVPGSGSLGGWCDTVAAPLPWAGVTHCVVTGSWRSNPHCGVTALAHASTRFFECVHSGKAGWTAGKAGWTAGKAGWRVGAVCVRSSQTNAGREDLLHCLTLLLPCFQGLCVWASVMAACCFALCGALCLPLVGSSTHCSRVGSCLPCSVSNHRWGEFVCAVGNPVRPQSAWWVSWSKGSSEPACTI
jgi:hypothetical protein